MSIARPQKLVPGTPRRQSGAALVVGLILLMVLTLLAISGMNTSTLELQMAGNTQYGEKAFQSAEYGIEKAFRSTNYNTNGTATQPSTAVATGEAETYESTTQFNAQNGVTPVPTGGYSMGVNTGFNAYHFNITSTGTSSRNATATNVQGVFVVGPSGT